ncbi:DUF2304 domain-containing protein [Microbacterium terrisoli]|jgi:hypothetical protein|uniref:DUF2304 domain-containing protein n=1 Tax=Microbacterium terrisoli TaxID=3242192 RepID=UPI0028045704|nr:DUF2304 domain-containing protein [Microbacterium protaetiae]
MTSTATYLFGILAAVLVLIAIIELMRRGTLRERHALWWMVGGVLALVVAVFPQVLRWASRLLGIVIPINLIFFIAIGLLFLVSLQYGAELTRAEDKMRTLAEQTAFLDLRLRALEAERAHLAEIADDADGRAAADAETAGDPPADVPVDPGVDQ